MPFGKTLELIEESRKQFWRAKPDRDPVYRDRSLRGKERVKARKFANKASRMLDEEANNE